MLVVWLRVTIGVKFYNEGFNTKSLSFVRNDSYCESGLPARQASQHALYPSDPYIWPR